MRIENVAAGLSGVIGREGRGENVEGQDVSSANGPAGAGLLSPATTARFRDILAHFNVRQISPREFSELIRKLHDAGEINEAEFKELAGIRLELDLEKAEPDEPMDLVAFFQNKLRRGEEEASRQAIEGAKEGALADVTARLAPIRRQLDWLEKFAVVHAGGTEAFQALA